MLTIETKRHIDSARQVLVGKVPDPKSQIDQITNALIYKFMDDMDVKAIDAGGKASFFVDELEPYGWRKLMDPRKGSQERMNLYTEALEKFSVSSSLPTLFRDIFRQAFLPYRDPETLNLFLKEIEFFSYSHSEELGNAFEYLLSIMGAQGDAGQFRTPRHIIDFMVDVIDPDYTDTILDPACGTAGFLISAYNHIVEKHDGVDENGNRNSEQPLSYQQRQKLMDNMEGYDISSDMVKLARVNMYLHGNNQPKIYEYDSLTYEDRWNDNFGVIMANPPFMTPKGGIKPHNRFAVSSKRAEVLFTDYILEHLRPDGKAAVIVPDGIVHNQPSSYKSIRRLLIDNGLFCVVSLHGQVFAPYANAKTSILFIDKKNKRNECLFVKITNDGRSKNDLRVEIDQNDLPAAKDLIESFKKQDVKVEALEGTLQAVSVPKKDIQVKKSLSASYYIRQRTYQNNSSKYDLIKDLFTVEKGSLPSKGAAPGKYKFVTASSNFSVNSYYSHDCEAIVLAVAAAGSLGRAHYVKGKFIASNLCVVLKPKVNLDLLTYYYIFNSIRPTLVEDLAKGASKQTIGINDLKDYFLPKIKNGKAAEIADYLHEANSKIEALKGSIDDTEKKIKERISEIWE